MYDITFYNQDISLYYNSIKKAVLLSEIHRCTVEKLKQNEFVNDSRLIYYSSKELSLKLALNKGTARRHLIELTKDGILFSTTKNFHHCDTTKSYLLNIEKYNSIINRTKYSDAKNKQFIENCNKFFNS
jgi:DNA-binding transcriptional regulator YhcF (GntR family)